MRIPYFHRPEGGNLRALRRRSYQVAFFGIFCLMNTTFQQPKFAPCRDCGGEMKVIPSKINTDLYLYCPKCYTSEREWGKECCFQPDAHYVRYTTEAGYRLREECKSCGSLRSKNIKHSTVSNFDKLPIHDKEKQDKRAEKLREEGTKFHDWVAKKRREQFFDAHSEYLNSPEWKRIRALVLQRDQHLCQSCRLVKANQVHHLTYERWRNEACFDLISVCTPCHEKLHKK